MDDMRCYIKCFLEVRKVRKLFKSDEKSLLYFIFHIIKIVENKIADIQQIFNNSILLFSNLINSKTAIINSN